MESFQNTNEVFSDAQKREIESLISQAEQDIRLLDTDNEAFSVQLKAKSDRIARLRGLISLVRDLPNEILVKIFNMYVQISYPKYEGTMPKPPWTLGCICIRWREVALATPELWKNIVIKPPTKGSISSTLEILTTLFLRVGYSPISCIVENTGISSDDIHHFLPLFTQNTSRFHRLRLRMNESNLQPIFELPGKCLTTLHELDIHFRFGCYPDHNPTDDRERISIFEGAPMLQRVSITTSPGNAVRNFNPLWFNLSWAQLTHLRISIDITLSLSQAHELFRQCVNLVNCTFSIPMDDQAIGELPTITLQYLEQFSVTTFLDGRHGQFLRSLLLPSLKRLSLSAKWQHTLWRESDVIGLITRSACEIEAIQLLTDKQGGLILALLERMPSLRRLSIRDSKIFPSLIRRVAHEGFLPRLALLKCEIVELSDTIAKLEAVLTPHSFEEPREMDVEVLNIVFVPSWTLDIGYGGLDSMEQLGGNRLKLRLKKNTGVDEFLDYADVGEYEAEDLVDDSYREC